MATDVLCGQGAAAGGVETPPLYRPRRLSMEEDFYYREIMTGPRRPSNPPAYDDAIKTPLPSVSPERKLPAEGKTRDRVKEKGKAKSKGKDKGKGKEAATVDAVDGLPARSVGVTGEDHLPPYWCDVHAEGVFMRKMEIEETVKRAEDRTWHMVYLVLHGTALHVYHAKKEWGWKHSRDGPNVSPDNPPWVKKASLEHSYSLLHADAGIATDYVKRRYVIRLRVETDQFLLSCVELGTFVHWLESLFAAIDVASPLEERDFPRDHSIPRIQRLRWFRGQQVLPQENRLVELTSTISRDSARSSATVTRPPTGTSYGVPDPEDTPPPMPALPGIPLREDPTDAAGAGPSTAGPHADPIGRLSTTSYPNEAVDPSTGKWAPRHGWTATHDHLYAKLCYAVLLFRSPRKSNYIIMRGKQWFVDWATGRMFRVLPPAYDDVSEMFSPWQVITSENRRI